MATSDALAKGSYYWYDTDQLTHPEKGHDLYDPRSDEPPDVQLVSLMREHGWIGPPMQIVRESKGSEIILITDGRRRHRAAEEVNKTRKGDARIRCKAEFAKGDAFDSMLVGNLGRKDETPIQLADKVMRLEKNGYPRKDVARKFGVSEQTISNWLALAAAPKDVKDAVKAGLVTPTLAKDLAQKPLEERTAILADGPVKGAKGKARVAKVPSLKVPARMVKALHKDLAGEDAAAFKGTGKIVHAFLSFLLGEDPNGDALRLFAGGAEIVAKVRP